LSQKVSTETFLELAKELCIIDVRSPSEYAKAHIPNAINIPLFSDEERAKVGTAYKKQGKEIATLIGLEIVGPKMRTMAEKARKISKGKKLLVHCWRGGMRSESMAWLFEKVGVECILLRGGYKSYRRFSKNQLTQAKKIVILSGSTGSGKTDVLKAIQNQGEQIIDLEGLAHHKGSAFGAIGEPEQDSTEQFENNLFDAFNQLDLNRRIWIEDESKAIGKNYIPDELFKPMRSAKVIRINIPKEERIARLVEEYTHVDKALLIYHLNRISKRLGPQHAKAAIEAVEKDDMQQAVDIALTFYDKAYLYGLSKREEDQIFEINLEHDCPEKNAGELIEFANKNQIAL
jgi:tRNA 2-selenouridine synthase